MKKSFHKLMSMVLSTALMISCVLPAGASYTGAAAKTVGTPMAEENTGDMNRIPYNNDDILMDLEAGTWAQPAVMDYDGDGNLDLVVSGTGVCYHGVYVFYGDENSKDTLIMSKADKVSGGLGNFYPTYLYEVERTADGVYNYTYEDTRIFSGSKGAGELNSLGNWKNYNVGITWPKEATRADEYSLVDYDGDGLLDLIRGVGNWNEYGWAGKFDSTGHWGSYETNDPLHGWVMWAKNVGTNEDPVYESQARLICINNDEDTPLDTYGHPAPSFYDWDGDGDLDLVCGNFVDDVLYFENIGTRTEPEYAEGVPFKHADGSNVQLELCMLTTTTFDWNQDGLPDLLVGEEDGRVCYYENTGEFARNGAPVMEKAQYFQTPADNLSVGILCTPFSIDWDGDGDEDIFTGDSAGFFSYIENITIDNGKTPDGKTASELTDEELAEYLTDPSWAAPVRLTDEDGEVIRIIAGANGSIQGPAEEKWGYTVLSMADWDGDGDMDIMANSIWGKIVWLENLNEEGETGLKFSAPQSVVVDSDEPDKPSWNWWDPEPGELVSQWRTTPFMIDLNKDGLMDIVMQDYEGYLAFFERQEDGSVTPGQRIFLNENGGELRLNSGTQGSSGRTKLLLVDWDGDGDLDIIRNHSASVGFIENLGVDEDGYYTFSNTTELLHTRQIQSHTTNPTVCDWNKDGTPDLIVGAEDGHFYYYVNKTNADAGTGDDGVENPDDHLMAHWDFAGENPLADKATAGSVQDTLVAAANSDVDSKVVVADGMATITGDGALMAVDSADISPTKGLTVFFKAKFSGSASGLFSIIDKRSFSSTPTYGEQRAFGIYADTTKNTMTGVLSSSAGPDTELPKDEWREFAMTFSFKNGMVTKRLYVSNGESTGSGDDFTMVEVKEAATSIPDTSNPFMIGNEVAGANGYKDYNGLTRQYADVRLYDAALSADQIAQILPYEGLDASLVAHWDFEGEGDEVLKDKAAFGTVSDTLTKAANSEADSKVTISNGVAKITDDGVLLAQDSADVNPTQEMTVFFKAKYTGHTADATGGQNTGISLIDKRSFGGSLGDARSYGIYTTDFKKDCTSTTATAIVHDSKNNAKTVNGTITVGEWREYALVVEANGKMSLYVSKGENTASGEDFTVDSTTLANLGINDTNIPLAIGNENLQKTADVYKNYPSLTREYDDVRIYNKALTADQLASILTADSGEDEVDCDSKLVAHWDFEGEGDAALADKAHGVTGTASTSDDKLTLPDSGVKIENGVAVISADATSAIDAGNLADVNQAGPMTIFMKVKIGGGDIQSNFLALADKRIFGGDAKVNRAYTLGINQNGTVGGHIASDYRLSSSDTMARNEWRELAYVVTKNATTDKLTIELYLSKAAETNTGDDFVKIGTMNTNATAISTTSPANLWLGRDRDQKAAGIEAMYDDVRIYNDALTADQLAGILEVSDEPQLIAPKLKSMSVDGLNLFPVFNTNTTAYTAWVANSVDSITVNAATKSGTITVNGTSLTNDSTEVALDVGKNTISVKCVHSEDASVYTEYTIVVTREAEGTDLTGALVAKWDFEGDTEEEQLADKGDNDAKTPLIKSDGTNAVNNILLENGRAVYQHGKISYLAAQGTDELNITSDLTLVARVKLDKINGVLGIVDHRHFSNPNVRPVGMFIGESGSKNCYGIGGQFTGGDAVRSSTYSDAAFGEWATLAMVLKTENGKLTAYYYVSTCAEPKSGADFKLITAPVTGAATLESTTQYLYVGNNTDMKAMVGDMEIDEVRIYNTALTMEQLADLDYSKTADALQELIDTAKALIEKDYTADSWAVMQDALTEAESVDKTDADKVNEAYSNLDQAIDGLTASRVEKNYYTIDELIELVKQAEAMKEEDYTLNSWSKVQVAISDADVLIEDNISPLPTPAAIKKAYLALQDALDGLEARPAEDPTIAEKVAAAKNAIEAADFTVKQAAVNSTDEAKAYLLDKLNQLISFTGIELTVEDIKISAMTPADTGVDGSYSFRVALALGSITDTAEKTGNVITATEVPVEDPGSDSGSSGGAAASYTVSVKDAVNGTVTSNRKRATFGTNIVLTVTADDGYVLDKLTVTDVKGNTVELNEKNGKYTFRMPKVNVTVTAVFTKADSGVKNPFVDVKQSDYFFDAVLWAVENSVTSGTSATTFSPDMECTRAQIVTFLWNAAGSPEPISKNNPFADVKESDYFYKAVLWAVENDVTAGTSETTFAPEEICTRAQAMTFQYKALGKPAVTGSAGFSDVAEDAYYANPVAWAVKNGVTSGVGSGMFGSDEICTRAQIVTFLYRCFNN